MCERIFVRVSDIIEKAGVAELADAHASEACSRKGVEVQVLSSAPFDKLRVNLLAC